MGAEVWIVVGVVVLLFGSSQVPKLARSLGQAKRELNDGMKESEKPESKKADPDA